MAQSPARGMNPVHSADLRAVFLPQSVQRLVSMDAFFSQPGSQLLKMLVTTIVLVRDVGLRERNQRISCSNRIEVDAVFMDRIWPSFLRTLPRYLLVIELSGFVLPACGVDVRQAVACAIVRRRLSHEPSAVSHQRQRRGCGLDIPVDHPERCRFARRDDDGRDVFD
jgi:hypothetical protein